MDGAIGAGLRFQLRASESPNKRFPLFIQRGLITIKTNKIFDKDDIFFTMGSCFAEEIRIALRKRELPCVPAYAQIKFDPADVRMDELPKREHLNFYSTFTVLNQIEEILGERATEADDFWTVTKGLVNIVPWPLPAYQDPYRRLIIGRTPEHLNNARADLLGSMRRGFDAATAFVFTFGMTEVFINKRTGRAAAQKPAYAGGGGLDDTELHRSSFEENLANVRRTVELIRKVKPSAPIVMSVSPVALERTFSDEDVVVVNNESKSILRAVLGQISREYEGIIYLPSYEAVTYLGVDAYLEDGRHVRREVVDMIVGQFFEAYFSAA